MTFARLAKTLFLILLAAWLGLSTAVIYVLNLENRVSHAVVSMGAGLVVLWVFLGGGLMFLFRGRIREAVLQLPGPWPVKFVLFATLLAMIEEAVTTTMTNLAPYFGVAVGEAYITASANYLDVILYHSVIVFIPWFIAWAWILSRWAFSPFWVFLLFGLNGLLAESVSFGWQNLAGFGLWIFVYGLMIYLPAYSLPVRPKARLPRPWHALLAFVGPFLFTVPWMLVVRLLSPGHPDIHFPPIQS
jgi:hypothetical protein